MMHRIASGFGGVVWVLQSGLRYLRVWAARGVSGLARLLTVAEGEAGMSDGKQVNPAREPQNGLRMIKSGPAMRVIFFYPGEEGTYIDNVNVTLYENGIVHIRSRHEETTTHLQNCEVLWRYQLEADDRSANKIRLLKPKGEHRSGTPADRRVDEWEESGSTDEPPSSGPQSPDDDEPRLT